MSHDVPRIYRYILGTYTVKRLLYFESGFVGLATPTILSSTLLACFVRCDLPLECLLNTHTTQAGLATSKTPQPQVNLIDIAAPRHDADCLCYGHRQAFEESVNVIKSTTFLCLQAFHKLADSLFHAGCIQCIKTLLILWWARISIPIRDPHDP
jgi:hypothetical protein